MIHKKNFLIKGFTLLELIIIFVLIFIIAGFILPNFLGIIDEKKICEAEAGVELLKIAIDNYYRNNNSVPASLGDLTLAQPRILAILPEDPYETDGKNYGYSYWSISASENCYVVYSQGPDKQYKLDIGFNNLVQIDEDDIAAGNVTIFK